MEILKSGCYGFDFISGDFLPPGKDEYWRRNEQQGADPPLWRKLKAHEIESLVKNGNYCADWNHFLVTDPFDPLLIRNSNFYGLVRFGPLREVFLKHHDFCIPAGIRSSTIISCDVGGDTAIQDCSYISHYIIGSSCVLSRIDEMQTTNHAKFGGGVVMDGESEDVRIWIDVMNEAGGRSILPFKTMIPADAYLWAGFRDDGELAERLKDITQKTWGGRRGSYGTVGSGSVIKSCAVIKDTDIGNCAYIKGAHKLKNITVLSSEDEPSQIGEGVEMVNGIVGYGCHVFYGSKAVRFVMGRNSNLKYGARLIHSVLGDNSTVSCCEILNNLIFPVHEQHHNNSFLIAGLVQGMSNIAAAATLGSNHNSRANDGEIRAGRGFWPGLSVTVKHSSRFASFVLITKGDYPFELNITLPFSMVSNNTKTDRLEVMPAYYWMYNLYALERNSRKSADRDRRKNKVQYIEMDYLAPDTAEEIIAAAGLIQEWMAAAGYSEEPRPVSPRPEIPAEIPAPGLERNDRGSVVLKPREALAAYREMLRYYAVKTLIAFFDSRGDLDFRGMADLLNGPRPLPFTRVYSREKRVTEWENMGGQIVPAFRVDELRKNIREKKITSWEEIHAVYGKWRECYTLDRAGHAWAVLSLLGGKDGERAVSRAAFIKETEAAVEIKKRMTREVYETRAKDFTDPYRLITYRNRAEMNAVAGRPEQNAFVEYARKDFLQFEKTAENTMKRLESSREL
ncbi:MAG: DUF4954 family protein [Treponema sp.]|jgi:hypothetical protein|nr:DUF4954 family protein [Treponema sp.]